jgi:hypothetical protein
MAANERSNRVPGEAECEAPEEQTRDVPPASSKGPTAGLRTPAPKSGAQSKSSPKGDAATPGQGTWCGTSLCT